jgi:chromosome segregation ATPase
MIMTEDLEKLYMFAAAFFGGLGLFLTMLAPSIPFNNEYVQTMGIFMTAIGIAMGAAWAKFINTTEEWETKTSFENKIKQAQEELESTNQKLAALISENDAMQKDTSTLKNTIEKVTCELDEVKTELEQQKTAAIANMNTIETLIVNIDDLQIKISEKNKKIRELRQEITDLKNELSEVLDTPAEADQEIPDPEEDPETSTVEDDVPDEDPDAEVKDESPEVDYEVADAESA